MFDVAVATLTAWHWMTDFKIMPFLGCLSQFILRQSRKLVIHGNIEHPTSNKTPGVQKGAISLVEGAFFVGA